MPPLNHSIQIQTFNSCHHCQFLTVGVGAGFAAYSFSEGLIVFFNSKSFGVGKERAKVLGDNGEYWVAWMQGYFHALKSKGANLDLPDVYAGTSVGSIISSVLSGGI